MTSLSRVLARIASTQSKTNAPPSLLPLQSAYSTYISKRSINGQAVATITETKTSQQEVSSSRKSPTDWPRPTEVPFQPKVANSVNLIGKLSAPIVSEQSADGKFWATTVISQDAYSNNHPPFMIPIVFEGNLAHIAVSHLNESSQIHVAGQLTGDPPPIGIIEGQYQLLVLVNDINFVKGSSHRKERSVAEKQEAKLEEESGFVAFENLGVSRLNTWKDFVGNPKEWWDYRDSKLSGSVRSNHPDFKRKDGTSSLWLDKAPQWVLSELEGVEFDVKKYTSKKVKQQGDESWKDLVANPNKWWDNRLDKRNAKAPDFKNKETGDALWLNGCPSGLLSKLPPLKHQKNNNAATGGTDTLLS